MFSLRYKLLITTREPRGFRLQSQLCGKTEEQKPLCQFETDYKKWNSGLLSGSAFIRGMHQVSPGNDQNIMNNSARIQSMSRGVLCWISVSVFLRFVFFNSTLITKRRQRN